MSIQRFDKVTIEPPKTYAETQGKPPFDWWEFLDRARTDGISKEEHEAAMLRAELWTTCACGNQCSVIPRAHDPLSPWSHGAPIDKQLKSFGHLFYGCISKRHWNKAAAVLQCIEARSAQLIAELTPALELHP